MASYNRVILAGNLTRDPELRYTPKGTAIARIGLAINRTWKNEAGETKEEVTFVDVDAFGRWDFWQSWHRHDVACEDDHEACAGRNRHVA